MGPSSRQLNRATLARQLLLERRSSDVVDVVRRIVAVQAQEPASPYIALWNRIADFDPDDLDDAFADHTIVKSTLLRVTLHAVAADDHRTFREAMLGTHRAAGLFDRRFVATGLSIDEVDALVPQLLAFASEPRTRTQIEGWLAEHLGREPEPGLWRALRIVAPLVHAPTGGPWSFGPRPTFLAAPSWTSSPDHDAAVRDLVRRYLAGFGPASAQDIGQFTMLRQATVRPALAALADELDVLEGPAGTTLFDVPGGRVPAEDTPAPPRLLAMWDSVLLAHADRRRVLPEAYRGLVIRRNGDVLPTLLVDGYVSGVWRPVDGGIEATAFHRLPGEAWDGLVAEAGSLGALLSDRDPATYRRYARWWSDLPSAERHLLPVAGA